MPIRICLGKIGTINANHAVDGTLCLSCGDQVRAQGGEWHLEMYWSTPPHYVAPRRAAQTGGQYDCIAFIDVIDYLILPDILVISDDFATLDDCRDFLNKTGTTNDLTPAKRGELAQLGLNPAANKPLASVLRRFNSPIWDGME